MAGTYLCPYCYTEYKMWEVDFRCTNKLCKTGKDEKLTEYCGKETVKLMTYRPKKGFLGKMPLYADCPSCGSTSSVRLCPGCHNPLPEGIDEARDMIISIIGARDAGKSNYIGVLVHELRTRVCNKFGFSFSWITESQEEYVKRFGSKLYPDIYKKDGSTERKARAVERTESAERGAKIIKSSPIVCELARKVNRKLERYSFSFLDSAGEDFDDPDVMKTVMSYISHSQGIIFLLDPMQIPTVRKQLEDLDKTIVEGSTSRQLEGGSGYDDIIKNVASLIRTNRKMKKGGKIDIPVVVTFSKFDTLRRIADDDANARLWADSPHAAKKALDLNDLNEVSMIMKGLLETVWGLENFVELVTQNFSNVKYLPCSAFGDPPKEGEIAPPKPIRIEDGILWIMEELGHIPYVEA